MPISLGSARWCQLERTIWTVSEVGPLKCSPTVGSHQGAFYIRSIAAGADQVRAAQSDKGDEWQGADGILRGTEVWMVGIQGLTMGRKTSTSVDFCT